MSSKAWGQWVKVAKKQLRHLGRAIDQEIGNVLERHLPSQAGRVARVRVPVRSTPVRFPVRGSSYRSFHQLAGNAARSGRVRLTTNTSARVSLFSSGSRLPSGAPRALFTNWNMANARFSGRMYSTASIKFTHEAVSNLSLSLRCFFNALDGCLLSQGDGKGVAAGTLGPKLGSQPQLSKRDISLIRDLEVFEMIRDHRAECAPTASETIGCCIEFELPELRLKSVVPSLAFADSGMLDLLAQEVSDYTARLKDIESAVRRICDGYGALPITLEGSRLRIHFPNLTMLETEKLVVELGVTLGSVHPEEFRFNAAPLEGQNVLSSFNSVTDLSNPALTYSPVLSESCSSWDDYQVV